MLGQVDTDALGQLFSAAGRGCVSDDQKLITTPANDGFGPAAGCLQDIPDLNQYLIARQMSVGIVDVLESVQVDQGEDVIAVGRPRVLQGRVDALLRAGGKRALPK